MDPFAVANIATTIGKTAWSCVQGIYTFVDGNLSINTNLRLLHDESAALHNNAKGLGAMLKRPEMIHFHDAELWDDAYQALDRCQKPLDELRSTLRNLRPPTSKRWTAGDALRVIKKNLKDDTIDSLRSQLHSHNLVLSGIQGRLNMLISSKGYFELLQAFEQLRVETSTGQFERRRHTSAESTLKSTTPQQMTHSQPPAAENLAAPSGSRVRSKPRSRSAMATIHISTSKHRDIKSWRAEAWANKSVDKWEEWAYYFVCQPDKVPEYLDANFTPLHWAVWANNLEEVTRFLDDGDPVNSIGNESAAHNACWTPLHLACFGEDRLEVAALLISRGADLRACETKTDCTPLHFASGWGCGRVTKLLLENDAGIIEREGRINQHSAEGLTPLGVAVRRNNLESMQVLLHHKALIEPRTFLLAVKYARAWGGDKSFNMLVQYGGDVQEGLAYVTVHRSSHKKLFSDMMIAANI